MAIYHLSGQIISRSGSDGNTRSSVACAAYRSGEKLFDERSQETKHYTRSIEPVTKILAPENSPSWVFDREKLWNEVEKVEKRYDAQLAREFNIALPNELNIKEQEKLAYEFCQKAFVDKGMVADICIHNDKKDNSHFHVMLTIRPFKENGDWGAKAKKEYILDKDNNKIKLKSGQYKSRKIDSTDWNKKETMQSWRKQWEVMTNKALKNNGISEVITCESNKNLGNEKQPTIHEGYIARDINSKGRESEKINKNKVINEYNNTIINLEKYKEEKKLHDNYKKFYRKFSPKEKSILKNAAKELKIFINYENVNNRIEQLKKWEKSLSFKDESIDKTNKLNRVDKEEKILDEAISILKTEADRFLNVNYSNLDLNKLDIDERIEIVNTTVDNKKILNVDEILLLKDKVKEENLEKSLDNIFNNNTRFTKSVKEDIDHIETVFNGVVKKYNIDLSKPESAKNVPDKTLKNLEKMFNRKVDLKSSLKIINNIYDIKLAKMYPEWESRVNLKLEEKELFIMSKEYFGKTLMPDDFKNVPCKYNSKQQEEILNILDVNNNEKLKEKYPNFKINEVYKNMFYMECHSNEKLNEVSQKLVKNYFNKDNFMKDFKISEKGIINEKSNPNIKDNVKSNSEKSLLFDVISTLINEIDQRFQEGKFENDRQKKKSQKKKLQNYKSRSQEPSL
ncbi:MobQ family relaxase [uncultured Clostridium sp.]|uniref:MobQ family relaxase n=1 Tax=uncultured Clostridium sp. TaxID=59620 RepID=UPI002611B98F|nr:MobQ family relaxase [uncultured Clostridium sp.]